MPDVCQGCRKPLNDEWEQDTGCCRACHVLQRRAAQYSLNLVCAALIAGLAGVAALKGLGALEGLRHPLRAFVLLFAGFALLSHRLMRRQEVVWSHTPPEDLH